MRPLIQRNSAALAFLCTFLFATAFAQTPSLTNDDIVDRRVETGPAPVAPNSLPANEKLTANKTVTPQPLKNASFEMLKSASGTGTTVFANTLSAFEKVNSFRASVQIIGMPKDNRNYTMEIAYAKPDRFHLKMDEMEAITIGNIAYVKMKGQGWKRTERPNVVGTEVNTNPAEMKKLFDFIFSQIKINADVINQETIDGAPTNVYEFKIDAANSALKPTKGAENLGFRAWIGSEDNLLRKLTFSSPDNKFQLAVRLYDFNESIHITSPLN